MLQLIKRRWFLVALFLLIPWGMWLGYRADQEQVSTFPKHLVELASGLLTATVLFLMSITLENRKLVQSFRSPAPVIWAVVINFGLLPITAWGMLSLQGSEDFAVGLMVAACVPSTMAAASVWTRKAGGNDAVALLGTIVTNGSCFLVTPVWLKFALGDSVTLDTQEMIFKLFMTALLPILVGQAVRLWAPIRTFADRGKTGFGAAAQICILLIVFWAAVQSGVKLQAGESSGASGSLPGGPALIVWGSCVALHVFGFAAAFLGGLAFGFSRENVVGAAFSGSQKTLPIGIYLAADLAQRGYPFAVLPILMFHASQLVLDTLVLDRLNRWVHGETPDRDGGNPDGDDVHTKTVAPEEIA